MQKSDGIYSLPKYGDMSAPAKKLRDFYAIKPGAPVYQKEFFFFTLGTWIEQGYLRKANEGEDYDAYLRGVFGYDQPAASFLNGLGWCEAAFLPAFEEEILEDRGEYELVRDRAGRSVLYFKGRRNGFMPEYVDHPVKDFTTWERDVKWRLDPRASGRLERTAAFVDGAVKNAPEGNMNVQNLIGGYMYLRSLMGPEDLLYNFVDQPELIHDCMKTWFELSDHVIAHHQKSVSLDEVFIAEDICYNHGSLISPDMMGEFLIPYYQQLLDNIKKRNLDKNRHVYFQVDTDGDCRGVIDIYKAIGCDYMSPFEVASGCDVVEIGKKHPDLRILGGIDKRVLATSKEDIDRHIDYIMPAMAERGGYIPTCDHGVPEEVSFENYMYYREKMKEY